MPSCATLWQRCTACSPLAWGESGRPMAAINQRGMKIGDIQTEMCGKGVVNFPLHQLSVEPADPRAAWWVGEDALPPGLLGSCVPDAVLMHRGMPVRAVEFGGAYPPERFEKFHEYCSF